jgi:nucleotide-binding universal stress UspA family protein
MSFGRILVAIDGSPISEQVFEQAIELARKDAGQMLVFHGIELSSPSYVTLSSAVLEKQTEQAKALIQSYADQAKKQGIAVAFTHYVGDPGINICDLAQSWKADLIILGRRGLKGLAEFIAGSVSNHVMHHAPYSVLVVQGDRLS